MEYPEDGDGDIANDEDDEDTGEEADEQKIRKSQVRKKRKLSQNEILPEVFYHPYLYFNPAMLIATQMLSHSGSN